VTRVDPLPGQEVMDIAVLVLFALPVSRVSS